MTQNWNFSSFQFVKVGISELVVNKELTQIEAEADIIHVMSG